MIFRQFKARSLSGLGLGMMRLPVVNGDDNMVDEGTAAEMIDYAYKNGINYFDTAWGCHNGNSELTAGKLLSRYPREGYYIGCGSCEQVCPQQIKISKMIADFSSMIGM